MGRTAPDPEDKPELEEDVESVRFEPKKKLEDLETWAQANDLADHVLLAKPKNVAYKWGSKNSIKGAVAKGNEVFEEIDRLQSEWGIRLPKVKRLFLTKQRRGKATVWHDYKYRNICFSDNIDDKHFANARAWTAQRKDKARWFTPTAEAAGGKGYTKKNVRHEYGHIIDGEFGVTNSAEWRKLREDLLNKDGFNRVRQGQAMSDYSRKNKREYWAEAFEMVTSPHYKKGMLPARLEGFVKGVLKKMEV